MHVVLEPVDHLDEEVEAYQGQHETNGKRRLLRWISAEAQFFFAHKIYECYLRRLSCSRDIMK
jgi:hypothetical protein